jgi:hypothetical protein
VIGTILFAHPFEPFVGSLTIMIIGVVSVHPPSHPRAPRQNAPAGSPHVRLGQLLASMSENVLKQITSEGRLFCLDKADWSMLLAGSFCVIALAFLLI